MNYNIFTKSELIEAIKYSGNSIDLYLLSVWNKKTTKLLNEISEINKKATAALKNKDYKLYQELNKKSCELDKKYEKLLKALK